MMRKYLILALSLLLTVVSCNPTEPEKTGPTSDDLVGAWELTSVVTKASVGGSTVNVYIAFNANGQFDLYQQLGQGWYHHYSGTWSLSEDTIQGKYSNDAAWGPWTVTLGSGTLSLTKGTEQDTYKKISGIPDNVTAGAVDEN
jgi:hypothetical protein